MSATLKDIADELNISATAVSRALRDMPDIGPETTRLVKETAARLGYRKNLAARYLKTNKSMMFGIVVTDICNPVFSSMYKGIEKICMETNYTLMLGNSNENAREESAVIANMLDHGVDGIFLVPSMQGNDVLTQLENANVPYVILQRKFPGRSLHCVQSNDYEGGYLAAEHLYHLGHRSFLYVTAPMHISSARERYDGFAAYLRERKMAEEAVQILECDGTRTGSYKAVKRWLGHRLSGENRNTTAIFCFSDYVACGAYSAIHDCGLRIPEDISVIGYDNIEYSDMMQPALTTIDIHPYKIGRRAAKKMFELIGGQKKEERPLEMVISPKLIQRSSTALCCLPGRSTD